MSSRSRLRVAIGVTNVGAAAHQHQQQQQQRRQQQRPGTASTQLSARVNDRNGNLLCSAPIPALGQDSAFVQNRSRGHNQPSGQATSGLGSPLPPHDAWGGVSARPSTTPGVFGHPTSGAADRGSGRLLTPPRSSPGMSRRHARLAGSNINSSNNNNNAAASSPLYPSRTNNAVDTAAIAEGSCEVQGDGENARQGDASTVGRGYRASNEPSDDGPSGIPLGLHKMSREELEVYVGIVRSSLARKAEMDQGLSSVGSTDVQVPECSVGEPSGMMLGSSRVPPSRGDGNAPGGDGKARSIVGRKAPRNGAGNCTPGDHRSPHAVCLGAGDSNRDRHRQQQQSGKSSGRRKHRTRSRHHHHHHHHHHYVNQNSRSKGGNGASTVGSSSATSLTKINIAIEDGMGSAGGSWFSRSKGSKTVPLRTLLLDPEVNNIPQVGTQSDFRALIKAQNIPHSSYDIDDDGVVSQEDYALAKRFDVNGDGMLDEAEKFVGRRIMTEMFLERHKDDLHLFGDGLAQRSVAETVDAISRSRGFKKIMNGLREKEKKFVNHGSMGVRECVTLKPESLTRHNFFNDKFDTTAWNDFTRDPREPGWLDSRRHDGSRNQMYFMRKVEARESAQGRLNSSYKEHDAFSTRRINLITDPSVENC